VRRHQRALECAGSTALFFPRSLRAKADESGVKPPHSTKIKKPEPRCRDDGSGFKAF
jgi:hypothetical protein